MPELIVFDLDGVLIDVTSSYRVAVIETVAALGGGAVSPDQVQELKNAGGFNNDWHLSRELLRRRGRLVPLEEVVAVFNRFYLGPNWDGLILRERWLLDEKLLERLRRRFALAVFTGRPLADAEFSLRRFGVAQAFSPVLGLEAVAAHKPAPDGLLQIGGDRLPAAYLGDTVDDARCAAAAGVPFIGISAPGQLRQAELEAAFRAAACDFIAPDVDAAARRLLR